MSSEQNCPVVLQIGTRFIRVGFAGEAQPLITHPTNSYDLKDAPIVPIDSTHASLIHNDQRNEANLESDEEGNLLWMYDLINHNAYKLESLLERIIYTIYTRHLLIDSKKYRVLVLEPVYFPLPLKAALTKVLLFHMHAKSVMFYPEPIMSCVSSGSHYSLVVDLSWGQSTVTPVYDLRCIYNEVRTTIRSGRLIHKEYLRKFQELKLNIPKDQWFQFIERFILRYTCCRLNKEENEESEERTFEFEGLEIPKALRYEPLESVLFQNSESYPANDTENQLITTLIHQSLQQLNIDLRSQLAERLIFTGGISKIPGVKLRILNELRQLTTSTSSLKLKAIKSLGPWQGASLYCATALMNSNKGDGNEVLRDKYLNHDAKVIDWCDSLYKLQV